MRAEQRASEEEIRRSLGRDSLVKKGAGLAVGAASGLGAARVLPFLNDFIPVDLAIKGISKVSPKIGDFLKKGQAQGLNMKEGIEFLREQFSPIEKTTQEQVQQSNPLQDFETTYPDIAAALAKTIQNGQSPDAAAAILKTSTPFGKEVKKIEKETGKNFVDYILELFGNRGQQQGQQMQQPQQQMQGQQQMQQSGQQQGSGVDAQLMAALDKILKM